MLTGKFTMKNDKVEKQDLNYTLTSHNVLKYILVICQFIGLFPMHNICSKDPSQIKFTWFSWKIVYTITISGSSMFNSILAFYRAFDFIPFVSNLLFPVVFAQVAVVTLVSINASKNWRKCITSITSLELELNAKYGDPKDVRNMLKVLIFLVYGIGSIEHLFELIAIISKFGTDGIVQLMHQKCNYLYLECNTYWSVIYSIFCIISWAACIAVDVLIINLSVLFSSRFQQISDSFELFNNSLQAEEIPTNVLKNVSNYYKQIREDYTRLTSAVYKIDKLFGNLIICSYMLNVILILIQLFNSLRFFNNNYLYTIQFFYSFGFIIMRLLLVTIFASSIHEESRRIASIIPKVPDGFWCQDLQRIMSYICHDSTALTGGHFFKITRSLTLKIAASIITYELILIQFNESSLKADNIVANVLNKTTL